MTIRSYMKRSFVEAAAGDCAPPDPAGYVQTKDATIIASVASAPKAQMTERQGLQPKA